MNTVVPILKEIPNRYLHNKGKTTLFVTNIAKSYVIVTRTISWDEVHLPHRWTLEQATEPVKEENTEIEEIIEFSDGDVD